MASATEHDPSVGGSPDENLLPGLVSSTRASTRARKHPNPLTYPQSSRAFSKKLFKTPTSEYRGCPFWAWNAKLDKAQIMRQFHHFEEMGMGGFTIHVRTGLDTEYMGSEFMDIVNACIERAESKDMLICLYDEDRWPSGTAGGKVIKDYPEHKTKHLLFTPHPYGSVNLGGGCAPSTAAACRSENGYLLAKYVIKLDKKGHLKSSRMLKKGDPTCQDDHVWYAYVESNPPSPWFNGQTYVDTLSSEAIGHFIESTYDRYKDNVGDKFGATVPSIFTDEPQFTIKTQLSSPFAQDDIFLPWTSDLEKSYGIAYPQGENDLLPNLPQVIWDLPDGQLSMTRYRYHDHVCERFVSAFMDQIGAWCGSNNIMLNGHMMEEPTLRSQTTALGEAMRCYRGMQMPGMDLLNDWVEFNTAKQVSSVARQKGVRGAMTEIYGCTHWFFTFEGHKGCGDWQAALGITFRVQHLAWLSMLGEAKRDYPASINYHSPWYKEYRFIEDHFARVNVALTRGTPVTRVAVVHPIESFWLAFGPNGSSGEMDWRDQQFAEMTSWLLHGLIDFDFISESLLPKQYLGVVGKTLRVGACTYDAVILPNLRTVRNTTFEVLQRFVQAGGTAIVAGQVPDTLTANGTFLQFRIDDWLRSHATMLPWEKGAVLRTLEPLQELRVTTEDGKAAENLLYQMRRDDDERFVFICNTDRNYPVQTTVHLKGTWEVCVLDTFTGEEKNIEVHTQEAGWTSFPYRFEGCASLLLRLCPAAVSYPALEHNQAANKLPKMSEAFDQAVELLECRLSEPNVLLLDYAQYRVDREAWSEATEVLRIDNIVRDRLRMPLKGMAWRQPWTVEEADRRPEVIVSLKFTFESDTHLDEPTMLALEDADKITTYINGKYIRYAREECSWWVDEDITTMPIPAGHIRKGENTVQLVFPFGVLTNIERIYLLGRFKVRLEGRKASLEPWGDHKLTWGDITTQGMPFYVGNVTYQCRLSLKDRADLTVWVPHFFSPVLAVSGPEGEAKGHIALQPRTLDLGVHDGGDYEFGITAFGNRYNSFGHVHLPLNVGGCWPDVWRSNGWAWTDEYALRPIGILECPTASARDVGEVEQPDALVVECGSASEWVVVHRPMEAPEI